MEFGNTRSSTSSTDISTEIQVQGTDCEVYSDGWSGFEKLRKNADKLLVGSARLGKISSLCVCGERTKQIRCTAGNEGYHPSPSSSVLTFIVFELGWISRIDEVQQIAEMKKSRDLDDSVGNVEFRYRTIEECKVMYRLRGEISRLVLPNNGNSRQLLFEKLHASKLAGHLFLRKTLTALQ